MTATAMEDSCVTVDVSPHQVRVTLAAGRGAEAERLFAYVRRALSDHSTRGAVEAVRWESGATTMAVSTGDTHDSVVVTTVLDALAFLTFHVRGAAQLCGGHVTVFLAGKLGPRACDVAPRSRGMTM